MGAFMRPGAQMPLAVSFDSAGNITGISPRWLYFTE
jgi:hypothetical protein